MADSRKKFSENMACMKLFDKCLSRQHIPSEVLLEDSSENHGCKLELKNCLEAERAEIRRMRQNRS